MAIDGYGTGQSSLTRLVQLPAKARSRTGRVVRATTHPRRDRNCPIVRPVLPVAKNLDLATVAGGVEDAETVCRRALRMLRTVHATQDRPGASDAWAVCGP